MNQVAIIPTGGLLALVDRAAQTLVSAKSAAEVLEAHEFASAIYDAAKVAARIVRAKDAHDELLAKLHRAQADALDIEARAKRRLADEYDAAQERGEVATRADGPAVRDHVPGENKIATAADIGLSRKDVHEARIIRDAEKADPGIVSRTIEDAVKAGEEPTRAKVKRAAAKAAKRKPKPRQHMAEESPHDRDLKMLLGVWEASCESARRAFFNIVNEEK